MSPNCTDEFSIRRERAVIRPIPWSDHWSFWQAGYPGIMVTDTAPFRCPYYHTPQETPDKLDFDRLARTVAGLGASVARIAAATLP